MTVTHWRPAGWIKTEDHNCPAFPHQGFSQYDIAGKFIDDKDSFEQGADAMLEALFKLAKESPTGKFTIDSRSVNIYEVNK